MTYCCIGIILQGATHRQSKLTMKFSLNIRCLLCAILILNACKKDPVPGPEACLKLYDEVGQATGTSGDCTNDNTWQSSTLSTEQNEYLNFVDNISTTGTQAFAVTGIQAYPNPATLNSVLNFALVTTEVNKTVKVKLAITDANNNVVDEIALLRVAGIQWQINLPDSRYNSGEYYRVHYQLSADGNPNYFEGFGDFIVCDATNVNCYE